jgi:hypothetical protein
MKTIRWEAGNSAIERTDCGGEWVIGMWIGLGSGLIAGAIFVNALAQPQHQCPCAERPAQTAPAEN